MKIFLYILKSAILTLSLFFLLSACNQLDGDKTTGRYSIQGVVLDRDNKPVSGVEISVEGISGCAVSDESGFYSLEGLGKNSAAVYARKKGFIY